ncbi:MAG: DUF3105 domain-containing protein [Acidimicrobiia bacterium]
MILVVGLGGCGDGDDRPVATGSDGRPRASEPTPALCEPRLREALDPGSVRHVLPGAPAPAYATDPPTSGPHEPSDAFAGERTAPISRAVQVSQLEGGKVLLQYRDLAPDELDRLRSLAGADVIVAPNPDLPDRVVATAWTFKQVCAGVDVDALRSFAGDRVGQGPGSH